MNPVYDALIVGAGPAGSSLAASLAAQGRHVLLVERDELPRHKVCGEFLSPEAQCTLASQGLYGAVAACNPLPLTRAKLVAHSGRTIDIDTPGQAWGISRYALDAALAAAAEQRGAEVRTGTTVTGWQATGSGMSVQLRRRQGGDSAVETRALVMACGRHGLATLLPGAEHRPRRSHQTAYVGIKCHFANVAMPAQVELYLFPGGYIGINPVENHDANGCANGCANVCALASYAAFGRAGRSPGALIAASAEWNPAFGKRIRGAKALPDTECAVAPVETRRTPQPWRGLPLLGDTAAMIAPLCGDGMAMALRSAELCAPLVEEYLSAAFSWEELGRRYSRAWRNEFAYRLRMGRLLETLLMRPRAASFLFAVGAKLPAVANYLMRATRGPSPVRSPLRRVG